jgi:hypothetical protein
MSLVLESDTTGTDPWTNTIGSLLIYPSPQRIEDPSGLRSK